MKYVFSALVVSVVSSVSAQVYVPSGQVLAASSGNGLGVGTAVQESKVHIKSSTNQNTLLLDVQNVSGPISATPLSGGGPAPTYPLVLRYSDGSVLPPLTNQVRALLHTTGRLDLGSDFNGFQMGTVSSRLNVLGGASFYHSSSRFVRIEDNNTYGQHIFWWNQASAGQPANLTFSFGTGSVMMPVSGPQKVDVLVLSPLGKVGIGTSNFVGLHRLYIGGSMIAEEVVAKNKTSWPDYVFKRDYQMLTNDELRSYINEYGRLPHLPSAEDVEKNGQALAANQVGIVRLIEEMHLRILQLSEEVELLRKQLSEAGLSSPKSNR